MQQLAEYLKVIEAQKRFGYPIFTGAYNLNLIGVRNRFRESNAFNDRLYVFYDTGKDRNIHCFDMTSDPGVYYRENPLNVDGTAVLAPGHYRSCWQVGKHQGKYDALVQRGEMIVFRDGDQNDQLNLDDNSLQAGLFGINLHRANARHASKQVDKWSAGCQVMADPLDFDVLMALVKKSAAVYGDRFSYTLWDEGDL
jgi:hypothetical protein